MSNQTRNFDAAKDKGRLKFWQKNPYTDAYEKGPDLVNNEPFTGLDSAGTSEVDLIGVGSDNLLRIGGSLHNVCRTPLVFRVQTNAGQATAFPFYVRSSATDVSEIDRIDCVFDTADGAANTGWVTKDGAGVAPGSGTSLQSGTFNLNATANTVQTATLAGVRKTAVLTVASGDQLTFNIASAVTNLKGLVVVVWFKQHASVSPACLYMNSNASIATKTFYLNVIPGLTITGVGVRWSTAGTDAGAVTVDVTKDVSTNAPGAGTSVLTAAQSVKGTINTTVYPALSATASVLKMAAGDRLALKVTGTTTALAGLVITVYFATGIQRELVIVDGHFLNQNVDQTMFIADGYYEVIDVWGTWSVISTSVKELVTKDGGTTAPGAGTGLLSDNTNAGLDTNATANTPAEGTLVTAKPSLILSPGDRLGEKYAGTVGSLAGLCTAVRLRRL